MMLKSIWGIALAFWLAASPALGENAVLEKELQDLLEAFLLENEMAPGLSVYVICPPAQLDWAGAAGTIAKGDSTPLTAAHTVRIASNTKTYVAAAVLRLAEMGRIGLDDSLDGYLNAEHNELLRGDGYDTDVMTIAQVLSHTAGLGDHSDDPRFTERIMTNPQYTWS
ncbi:MAG: beta-lactamase family protein, partial [Candidatus Latescibacterota bacterium]